ncbi:hypothetical protein [Thermaurantimonas aggregans]|uniref:hypothetical protein n=1 Tax=Thermaurantimonas aggregans TaxID=2173829 RepID=UPI0013587E7F|nr:hypothetical protein [Thermaurantimonas aggregans]MCX8147913.1 hypothetical protein [Thermaurantimonas aggregans]
MHSRDKKRRSSIGRLRPKNVSASSDTQENELAEKLLVIGAIVLILVIAYFLSK